MAEVFGTVARAGRTGRSDRLGCYALGARVMPPLAVGEHHCCHAWCHVFADDPQASDRPDGHTGELAPAPGLFRAHRRITATKAEDRYTGGRAWLLRWDSCVPSHSALR